MDEYTQNQTHRLNFGPFYFDLHHEQLLRDKQVISLRAKSMAVLRYLLHNPGRLVSKRELLENVWQEGYVTKVALRVCIREIRIALQETASTPRYIATDGQRGYRFIAKVQGLQEQFNDLPAEYCGQLSEGYLVGRDSELNHLLSVYHSIGLGQRQCLFVTGEAGIGKTTLLRTFIKHALQQPGVRIAMGQCVEQYGSGEAYRPVLEAMGRLCRAEQGAEQIKLLQRHAPTWLLHMPSLLNNRELRQLQARISDTTQVSMLREMVETMEVMTREQSLILILEDLHWCDHATIELLAVLARRPEPAHLLIIGTYRPMEIAVSEHPLKYLKQELEVHILCEEIALKLLSQETIGEYLALRFPQAKDLSPLAEMIHDKTAGNALFMVNTVNALIAQGLITHSNQGWRVTYDINTLTEFSISVPLGLQEMIKQQLEKLGTKELQLLRVASVGGVEFSTAVVAAGTGMTLQESEEACEALARRWPFIRMLGLTDWPDGTLTSRYQFSHALYQNAAYAQLAAARKVRLHRLIGERLVQGYAQQAADIAAELAAHFIQARDPDNAVSHCHQAGKNALQRNAQREALYFLTKGLELVRGLPKSAVTLQQELELNLTYATVLMNKLGFSAPEVKKIHSRSRVICHQLEAAPHIFPVLVGLWSYYLLCGELNIALEMAKEIHHRAQHRTDTGIMLAAHYVMAATLQPLGEAETSHQHCQQGIALYKPEQHHELMYLYAEDPGFSCHCQSILNLWTRGYADQAMQLCTTVHKLAQRLDHTLSVIQALGFNAVCLHYCRNLSQLYQQSERMIELAEQQNFPFWLAAGQLLHGWVQVHWGRHQEGLEKIQQALKDTKATGAGLYRTYYLGILAEASLTSGHFQLGLSALEEAFDHVKKSNERVYEAELYRLKGELELLHSQNEYSAEICFQHALKIARRQSAKFFELRASTSLSRLWRQQRKLKPARQLMHNIVASFSEGWETTDMQEANSLLADLAKTAVT